MMKKIVLLLALCATVFTGFAQKPLEFSTVIRQDSLNAQALYDITRNWFARTYTNNKAVVRDENPGKQITGKGSIPFTGSMMYSSIDGHIGYLIDIQFRDGRLKFTMSNFTHEAARSAAYDNNMGILVDSLPSDLKTIGVTGANRKASYKYYFKNGTPLCKSMFDDLVASLKNFLEKRETETKEDW